MHCDNLGLQRITLRLVTFLLFCRSRAKLSWVALSVERVSPSIQSRPTPLGKQYSCLPPGWVGPTALRPPITVLKPTLEWPLYSCRRRAASGHLGPSQRWHKGLPFQYIPSYYNMQPMLYQHIWEVLAILTPEGKTYHQSSEQHLVLIIAWYES